MRQRLVAHWRYTLIFVASTVQLATLLRVFVQEGPTHIGPDNAFFQHAGWSITDGAVPYVSFWDVKPPLIHETATVLSVVAGGDPLTLHLLSVATVAVLSVCIVGLVGELIHSLTGDEQAAILAGLAVMAHPASHYLPTLGLWAKFFSVFFGLLGLVLAHRGRSAGAGMSAAAAAGYWQFGLVFPLTAVGIVVRRYDFRQLVPFVSGGFVVTTLALAPIVLSGATVQMLSQVVVTPFLISESYSLLHRLGKGVLYLGYASFVLVLGVFGAALAFYRDHSRSWWIAGLIGWFGIQLLTLNFASEADLYPALVAVALGVGLLFHEAESPLSTATVAVVVAVTVVSALALGSFGVVVSPLDPSPSGDTVSEQFLYGAERTVEGEDARQSIRDRSTIPFEELPSMEEIYWSQERPTYCHYRLSGYEIRYLEQTGREWDRERCGFDSVGEILTALRGETV